MNPYQFETTCSVCGGSGLGTIDTLTAAWHAGTIIAHKDPRVCAENVHAREAQLKAREKAVAEREAALKE